MNTYQFFAEKISSLLNGENSIVIHVENKMPLFVSQVQDLVPNAQARRFFILSQAIIQKGKFIRDPEIMFYLSEKQGSLRAEPVIYINDRTGITKPVYRFDESDPVLLDSVLKDEIQNLAEGWFQVLNEQGFFSPYARQETLL